MHVHTPSAPSVDLAEREHEAEAGEHRITVDAEEELERGLITILVARAHPSDVGGNGDALIANATADGVADLQLGGVLDGDAVIGAVAAEAVRRLMARAWMAAASASHVSTRVPAIATTRSPSCMPAASARRPGVTLTTVPFDDLPPLIRLAMKRHAARALVAAMLPTTIAATPRPGTGSAGTPEKTPIPRTPKARAIRTARGS